MKNRLDIIDCGVVEYAVAWDKQKILFEGLLAAKSTDKAVAKIAEDQSANVLMLCEHPHVYTLGKSGVAENMLIGDEFLAKIDAKYFKTDRGGDITYHGYGQLVGYPILDLEQYGLQLKEYINCLEQTIIDTIAEYGIVGSRLNGATGVWLDSDTANARKIAAIGVKASRYVTMHGFALNVNTDLKYFSYINPCGFVDKGVTSIAKELGREVDFAEVKQKYVANFEKLFYKKLL